MGTWQAAMRSLGGTNLVSALLLLLTWVEPTSTATAAPADATAAATAMQGLTPLLPYCYCYCHSMHWPCFVIQQCTAGSHLCPIIYRGGVLPLLLLPQHTPTMHSRGEGALPVLHHTLGHTSARACS